MEEEDNYERQCKLIDDMFPGAKFTISIDLNDLDNIVTDKKFIIIQQTFNCYCYDNMNTKNKLYTVKCLENESLTNEYIINELIKQGLKVNCNHIFLESFDFIKDNLYLFSCGS